MALFKKKPKITYTFSDYCAKQINLYITLEDEDSDPEARQFYKQMQSRYTMMAAEYKRYQKEVDYLERKGTTSES